jgi:hypothetical protein
MVSRFMVPLFASAVALSGCIFGGDREVERKVVEEISGGVNPYLWRASLDTFDDMPLQGQPDPLGGVIVYDWKQFSDAPDERIKTTVYILDTRLRADGVKVSVFRQVRKDGEWMDADIDPATPIQLENRILERARRLKLAEVR